MIARQSLLSPSELRSSVKSHPWSRCAGGQGAGYIFKITWHICSVKRSLWYYVRPSPGKAHMQVHYAL